MKKNFILIAQKVAGLLIVSIILSVIITGLNVAELMRTRLAVLLVLTAGAVIVILANIRFSRNSFFILRNLPLYCLINGAAFLLYMLILFGTYEIGGNVIFTWLFSVTKFASYMSGNISTELALLFFGFFLFLSTALSPLGMSFLFMYHDNKKEENRP